MAIEIPRDLEQRLREAAEARGQSLADYVRPALEQLSGADPGDLYAGLRRATPEEVRVLVEAQGVRPVERLEELAGDFWPEDETCDDFIAWLRENRRHQQPRDRSTS